MRSALPACIAETTGSVIRKTIGRLTLLTALMAATVVSADQLVVRLDRFGMGAPGDGGAPESASVGQPAAVPSGLPSTLRLPLTVATDGRVTITLRQESIDESVTQVEGLPTPHLQLLSPAIGSVKEDASGKLAVDMDTSLSFGDVEAGKSKAFDIKIRGSIEATAEYGEELPIYVEGWRRGDDGKPLENPTKENRAFWGTVPGHFER